MEGEFSGDPQTIWLTENEFDRKMELIEDFWFRDRHDKKWHARKSTVVDGASIPRALWTLVGSPYTGDYRRASIVHDVACVEAQNANMRRLADKMFYEACRAGGCSRREAVILYVGVRIGAWYGSALVEELEQRPKLVRDDLDLKVERDFRAVADIVLSQDEVDDADVVEASTDAAGKLVAARRIAAVEALPLAAETLM